MAYNREKAIAYAKEWALKRNPQYFNFDGMGGDCTNFVSQCLYAGSGIMNYTKDVGWYYSSPTNRTASWSGVEYLHKFLTTSKSAGPYGIELPLEHALAGDIIQLSYDGVKFGHSLFIVDIGDDIRVAQHSSENDDNRSFTTYQYEKARLIHISGVRGYATHV